MEKNDQQYQAYINILKEELIPAMGCTEPIAIAYAGAKAREVLGAVPDRVEIEASDNIVKNVKSVVVPNTGGLRGIEASAAAGIVAGDADRVLEVIAHVDEAGREKIKAFLKGVPVDVLPCASDLIFDLKLKVMSGEDWASVRITNFHTNVVEIVKNGKVLFESSPCAEVESTGLTDRSLLNVADIVEFAGAVDVSEVADVIGRQIEYNTRIAEEGISGDWGANIGAVLLKVWGDDIKVRAKAMAAAGSDARMSGCELPVVIVSGSGNQGITASVPVVEYAKELGADQEATLRALVVSNLGDHPSENRDRAAVGLLRGGERRCGGRGRDHLAPRRRSQGNCPYHCQCPGHHLGHHLRRGQGLLCGQDCLFR
jgi:L-cysteine desulfidase